MKRLNAFQEVRHGMRSSSPDASQKIENKGRYSARCLAKCLNGFWRNGGVLSLLLFASPTSAALILDPIANVTLPAGKSLFVPVTATSTNGASITYTGTTSK